MRRWARIRRRGRGRIGKESRSRRGGARNARAFVSLRRAKRKGAEVGCEGPQMHLPQSLPLHRINGFARFFHGFISALLPHSGHTSKPQFFHCFSINCFTRALRDNQFPSFYFYFTWHHFPSVLLKFSIVFPLFYVIFPHFFQCFSHHFPLHCSPPKSRSEDGPGGNRYPTVTQLPPGT